MREGCWSANNRGTTVADEQGKKDAASGTGPSDQAHMLVKPAALADADLEKVAGGLIHRYDQTNAGPAIAPRAGNTFFKKP